MSSDSFRADQKTIDAVVRNFTVIGEAAANLPGEVMEAHPAVPWRLMREMRNVVVHRYFGVDPGILWETIQQDLAPLIAPLEAMLKGA